MRHRARALLAWREIFFGFEHFSALQVPDFDSEPFHRRGNDAERRKKLCVAVARDHLGGDWLDGQAEFLGNMLFHFRVDIGEGANRAGNRAGGDFLARGDQPFAVAFEFGIGLREFQTKGHRLAVDTVAATDGRGEFMLIGTLLDRREQGVDIRQQYVGSTGQLHRETSVKHITRGHALMHEARFFADIFGDIGQEGDHVMLHFALDLVDPRDVELALGPDRCCCFLGHNAEFRERVGGVRFDLEPDLEFRFWLPDGNHFGAGIAWDHDWSLDKVNDYGNEVP